MQIGSITEHLNDPFVCHADIHRGSRMRLYWYALHWLLGTAAVFLGFLDAYMGLKVYEIVTSHGGSMQLLNLLLSLQVCVIAIIYLMQDRWQYLIGQAQPDPLPSTTWNLDIWRLSRLKSFSRINPLPTWILPIIKGTPFQIRSAFISSLRSIGKSSLPLFLGFSLEYAIPSIYYIFVPFDKNGLL